MTLFKYFYICKSISVAARVRAEKQALKTEEKQSLKTDATEQPTDDTLDFREMPKITCSLLRNPVFMLITITTVITSLLTNGFAAYIAKYIQNQTPKILSEMNQLKFRNLFLDAFVNVIS